MMTSQCGNYSNSLLVIACTESDRRWAHHSSYRKIRADSLFFSILLHVFKSKDSRWNQVSSLVIVQFLMDRYQSDNARLRLRTDQLTSWKLHSSTLPGSARPFSHAKALVRSRHRASTIFPFFSLLTCGVPWFSNVPLLRETATDLRVQTQIPSAGQPQPPKSFIFSTHLLSINHQTFQFRQSLLDFRDSSWAIDEFPLPRIELLNERSAVVFLLSSNELTCWYDTIKLKRETVFPVPEGISSTQWPCQWKRFSWN
jgi:hypothetical protein